jgi:mRNA interferase MazF
VTRGEIYRTSERLPERGHKPGFYVVVSRRFVVENDDIATVICAPVYSAVLGVATEIVVGPEEGVPRTSGVRCDFLSLIFKRKLTTLVGRLPASRLVELDRAIAIALDLP